MSQEHVSQPDLAAEWQRARQHAGFSEDEVRVWFATGLPRGDPGASYFAPYGELGDHRLSDSQLDEAESEECAELHRVMVYPEFVSRCGQLEQKITIAALGAVMRHELEHARQQAAVGSDFFNMDEAVVDRILSLKVGGLVGGTMLYNLKPHEQDANAAAARYLQEHHLESVEAILQHPGLGHLARSNVGPESLDTLVARTVCFLYIYRDVCVQYAAEIPFDSRLAVYVKEAGELWRQLEARD